MPTGLCLLLQEWWDNHPFRVSTVARASYDGMADLVRELLTDLPNEENQ